MPTQRSALTRHAAVQLDAADPLAHLRAEFLLPAGRLYFAGHSLGPLLQRSQDRVLQVLRNEWGRDLVHSWESQDWLALPQQVGRKIARLIGARPDEVLAADSTSVNLVKLLTAGLRLRPERPRLLGIEDDFPTDRYLAAELAATHGRRLELVPPAQLLAALDRDVALLLLSHVHYKTSERFDLEGLTRAAHAQGALVLFDLSHSAGTMPLDLRGADVDFAVGCGYKYLNGGPGCPAFVFVAERLQEQVRSPLTGWLGHVDPFAFAPEFAPAPGIVRFQCGTPAILSLAAFAAALDVFADLDLAQVRTKALALGEFFLATLHARGRAADLLLLSPQDPQARGSHLAFRHPEARTILNALKQRSVVADFRPPDILRWAMTPLYLRYTDVWDAALILDQVLSEPGDRSGVI